MVSRTILYAVAIGISLCAFSVKALGSAVDTSRALIARYAPAQANQFSVEIIPAEQGRDTFEIESRNGKVVLRGSSGVAIASAFQKYLNDYGASQISWNGTNVRLPARLPSVPHKVRVVSPLKIRLAYNYCTHGYSMAFWGEKEWMRELDRLALHGLNAALIIQGQEAVWQNTFAKFGYTKEEIRKWLCSPAHQPWQFMGNMQEFEPPSQAIIDARVALGQKILRRCRELGIRPILQGYYGILPTGFAKKHPGARIIPQGGWVGDLTRPDMLNPGDSLFAPIAKTFLEEQEKLLGPCDFFAADPFHEGGHTGEMKRGIVYKQIQDVILAHNPRAVLVKQCWQTSNNEMFDAGNREQSLAVDLACEDRPFWSRANSFDGTPWAWGIILNFGGGLSFQGNPADMVADFTAALSPQGKRLEGIAMVPEGTFTNPLIFTLQTQMGLQGPPADLKGWTRNYLRARYGSANARAESAWDAIFESAYNLPRINGLVNSIISAAPRADENLMGCTWAPTNKAPYSNGQLATAWSQMLDAAPQLGDRETYRFDLADIARQVLTNYSRELYVEAFQAIRRKDLATLRTQHAKILSLIDDLDELTGTQPLWLMGTWVDDADKLGTTPEDRSYYRRMARMLVTTWVANPSTDLKDYANREWNGLLKQYYRERWAIFFDEAEQALAANRPLDQAAIDKKRAAFDGEWVRKGGPPLARKPKGNVVDVARRLLQKYGREIATVSPPPRPLTQADVLGTWQYSAAGKTYYRRFKADGTVQAFLSDKTPANWLSEFTWSIEGQSLIMKKPDQKLVFQSYAPNRLTFLTEGYGDAIRVPDF